MEDLGLELFSGWTRVPDQEPEGRGEKPNIPDKMSVRNCPRTFKVGDVMVGQAGVTGRTWRGDRLPS